MEEDGVGEDLREEDRRRKEEGLEMMGEYSGREGQRLKNVVFNAEIVKLTLLY